MLKYHNKKGPQSVPVAQVYGRNNNQAIVKYKDLHRHSDRKMSLFAEVFPKVRKNPSKIRQVILALGLLAITPPQPVKATASDATHLVTSEARRQGVPVGFALKMARIESGVRCHNHNKRSSASGPLQVLRGTARSLGYRGDIRRASCATQTHYGMKHLAMCWRAAKGRPALAKRCHQSGISAVYGRRR
jgi:soluble lytic murein transglycosylase-like protein